MTFNFTKFKFSYMWYNNFIPWFYYNCWQSLQGYAHANEKESTQNT